jgi:hypothetical protein
MAFMLDSFPTQFSIFIPVGIETLNGDTEEAPRKLSAFVSSVR